ncbi:MAG: hypothetical protein AAFY43_01755 [Pseudomonadota bacterium]
MSTIRKAQVTGGTVSNVGEFRDPPPAWASDWVDVDDTVGVGWAYDGSTFTAPAEPAPTEAQVRAELARRMEAGKEFSVTGYGQNVLVEGTQAILLDLIFRKDQVTSGALTVTWTSNGIAHTLTAAQYLELYTKALTYGEQLRAAMHAIIALDPIPSDFADDTRWP